MRVTVIGAGIIGVMSALKLQQDGHQVTLIDKEAPGSGCSFGNAGMLARSSFMPLSNASTVWQAPSWLLKANGPLKIDKRYLMTMLPWLYHYIKAGFNKDLTARAAAINQLTTGSVDLYLPLAALAG
jgi:D-amino-acid dehydrogenase